MFLQRNPRRHNRQPQKNSVDSKRNSTTLPIFGIDAKGHGLRETLLAAEDTREARQLRDVVRLCRQEVVQKVLEGLLCKAPENEDEEAFDETGVGPVPDGFVAGVFFLDGPAVGPG